MTVTLTELEAARAAVDELEQKLATAKAARDSRIVAASDSGLSLRAIAPAAGINHTAVRQIIAKARGR